MKLLINLLLSFSLLIPVQSYAADNCAKAVTVMNKGAQAPCSGFLFSPKEEERVYNLDQSNQLLQQELKLNGQIIDTYKSDENNFQVIINKQRQESELWRNAAETSTQKLVNLQNSTGQHDFWMIVLGVGLTIGAGVAMNSAAHGL